MPFGVNTKTVYIPLSTFILKVILMRRRGRSVPLERIDKHSWRIPQKYKRGMRVPGLVLADDELIEKIKMDRTLDQCANVAHLPGIYKYALTLPDGHFLCNK